jgi:hypothetical protein
MFGLLSYWQSRSYRPLGRSAAHCRRFVSMAWSCFEPEERAADGWSEQAGWSAPISRSVPLRQGPGAGGGCLGAGRGIRGAGAAGSG